jgi:hypothetical protein
MFEHLFAGELVFLFLGKALGFQITPLFLLVGAFWGFFPDILSFFLNRKLNYHSKFFHLHRDNLSHSLLLPVIIFFLVFLAGGWKLSLLTAAAILTHPLLDLFGIGWGVKLFLPFSQKIYKIFYERKFVKVFEDDKDREKYIHKYEVDNWFKRDYFTLSRDTHGVPWWWAIFEWGALALAIALPLLYLLKNDGIF